MDIFSIDTGNLGEDAKFNLVKSMRDAEKSSSRVCCMVGSGGLIKLNDHMQGYARIIKHYDGDVIFT